MRTLSLSLFLLAVPSTAAAHEIGFAHTHESSGGVSLAVHGGYALGPSLGGDYEACGAGTTCSARKRPGTPVFGARGGYEWANGLGLEVDVFGMTGLKTSVRRATTLRGEQATPANVDIVDDFSASGPALGVNATYTPVRGPISLTVAIGYAHWFASFSSTRTGTVEVDAAPSPRRLSSGSNADNGDSTGYELFIPQVRAGYPINAHFTIGLEVAAILGIGEARPKVLQVAESTADDKTPTYLGHSLGFIPQPGAQQESAMETFVLVKPSLFVRALF
jgi:hypothetical protein